VRSAPTSSAAVATVADMPPPPSTPPRRPDPDVPPPPPGRWPLADARPAPPRPTGVHGSALDLRPAAGLGLSFAAIAAFFVGQTLLVLVAQLVLEPAGLLDLEEGGASQGGAVLGVVIIAAQLAGLLAVLALLRLRSVPLRPVIGHVRPIARHLGVGAGLGLVSVVLSVTLVSVLVTLSGSEATPDQVLTQGIGESALQLLLAVIAGVVLAPIAEELVFRGLLHRALRSRLRLVPATLISSGLFAVVHVEVVASQPLALVGLAAVGVVLAVAYERTGSLLVPMTIHAVYNAVTVLVVVVLSRFDLDLPSGTVGGLLG